MGFALEEAILLEEKIHITIHSLLPWRRQAEIENGRVATPECISIHLQQKSVFKRNLNKPIDAKRHKSILYTVMNCGETLFSCNTE